jgi:hypothetical protein
MTTSAATPDFGTSPLDSQDVRDAAQLASSLWWLWLVTGAMMHGITDIARAFTMRTLRDEL